MIKIASYKLRQQGGGVSVWIPPIFRDLLGLKSGDEVEWYRDPAYPERLILSPKGSEDTQDQAEMFQ
jgi:bifunctional DNA-binding transcriptional regulator/antitoxin component of YhaV-PrlF toxin-antitoxin module